MVFVPTTWENAPSTATPITAEQLNRMEAGIVEGARAASETQAGNVELASAAEMLAGSDLTRAPSVKRVADYVAAQISGVTGGGTPPPAASETVAGIVELASAAEMTAGTDLTRAPSVKRVADYVVATIAGTAPPPPPSAGESAPGLVELATDVEMNAGTDLTRVPAVKRVADYVSAQILALTSASNPFPQYAQSGNFYATVQDEGSALPARQTINFRGGAVIASDDSTGLRTIIDVPAPLILEGYLDSNSSSINSTSLATPSALQVTLPAVTVDTRYYLQAAITYVTSPAAGLKLQLALPSGCTIGGSERGPNYDGAIVTSGTLPVFTGFNSGFNEVGVVTINGRIKQTAGSAGGSMGIKFAQQTTDATLGTYLKFGTWMLVIAP